MEVPFWHSKRRPVYILSGHFGRFCWLPQNWSRLIILAREAAEPEPVQRRAAPSCRILGLLMITPRVSNSLALFLMLAPLAAAQSSNPAGLSPAAKPGHSFHGESFDTGPRQKPRPMEGIGEAHFPITTKNPEVQKWFDQGNALLHSFWYYEAERAFRWCLKLEPDNAMAYWGLARSAEGGDRAEEFIREAAKRKDRVSERERLYIEASEAEMLPDPLHDKNSDNNWE